MKILINFGLFAITFCSLNYDQLQLSAMDDRSIKKAPIIGVIKSEIEYGDGCYFTFVSKSNKNGKPAFRSLDTEKDSRPIMNIDGEDIRLEKVVEKRNNKRELLFERYIYRDIPVTLTFFHIKDGREGSFYKVKIVAKRGNKSTVVQTEGYCGS
jgi:hypothetical protein